MRLLPEDNVVALIVFLIIFLCAIGVFFHYVPAENVKAFGDTLDAFITTLDAFITMNFKIVEKYLMIVMGVVAGAVVLVVACYWIGKLALRWRRVVEEPLKEIVKLFRGK